MKIVLPVFLATLLASPQSAELSVTVIGNAGVVLTDETVARGRDTRTAVEARDTTDKWYKGNLHVHTDRSDGRSPPEEVIEWYATRGYHFLAVTDHDMQTVSPDLERRWNRPGDFIVLPGVEVTDRVEGRPVHLNGIGVGAVVLPRGGPSVPAAIDRNKAAIEYAGGVAILNHPNGLLRAALSAEDIAASGVELFEVCCADYQGGSGHPSTDEIWDAVLSTGRRLYGVAADDAHDFTSRDPGASWVMLRASELSRSAILSALRDGDFYATTGAELDAIDRGDGRLCVTVSDFDTYGYRIEYVGSGGRVLASVEAERSCYALEPGDPYVRARVFRSDGARAWVQPVFAGDRENAR